MSLEFFDANACIGLPTKAVEKPAADAGQLLEALSPSGVTKALVWHISQHDYSPVEGNRMLAEAIAGSEDLFGCWTILPPQTEEIKVPEFFEGMKASRIFAVRAFPDDHHYMLNSLVFGLFAEEMYRRRIPLLLSLERGITWRGGYDALRDFPNLKVILCDIGIWGADRYTWPLLDAYPNLYIETSLLSLEAGGLEAMVKRFGADRLLFGSGYPTRSAEAPALSLTHADISDEDKQKIASGNLEKLISEVRL